MLQNILLLLMLAAPQMDAFKKEAPALQAAVDEAINSSVPGLALLQPAKTTYLESFGVVVMLEVALVPPPNPFSNPKTPAEIRKIVSERRPVVQGKLEALLKERIANLTSVGATESLAIVVHLFNSSPPDLPGFPSQFVLSVKKASPTQVLVREIK